MYFLKEYKNKYKITKLKGNEYRKIVYERIVLKNENDNKKMNENEYFKEKYI